MRPYPCNSKHFRLGAAQLKKQLVKERSAIELREFVLDTVGSHINGSGVVLKPKDEQVEVGYCLGDGNFKCCVTIPISEFYSLLMKIDRHAGACSGQIFSGGVLSIGRINKELRAGDTVVLVSKHRP